MRGRLNGGTLETLDGYNCYKLKPDALETKLYFRCKMYSKGCRVILHTEYVDRDDDDLKVIFKSGKHNHAGVIQNSSDCGVGRGRKRKYARDVDGDEASELEDDEGEDGGDEGDDGDDYDEKSEDREGSDDGERNDEEEEDDNEDDEEDGEEVDDDRQKRIRSVDFRMV